MGVIAPIVSMHSQRIINNLRKLWIAFIKLKVVLTLLTPW